VSDIDRAHGRELAATGGVADNVEESVKSRLGGRRAVQCAIVLVKRSHDWRFEGADAVWAILTGERSRDHLTAVLERSIVAIDYQGAAATTLPLD
jgi:hypothetical protein